MDISLDRHKQLMSQIYGDDLLKYGIPERDQVEQFAKVLGMTLDEYREKLVERLGELRKS